RMFEKEEIIFLQEILMNSWPADHYYFLNGWILRFNEGVTARANSVLPLNYKGGLNTIDMDIIFVEKAYQAYNLPAIFTMPDFFEPNNLDTKLLEHGYQQLGCITHTLIASVQNLRNETINEDFTYLFYSKRVKEFSNFLATFSNRDHEAQKVLDALSNRIVIPQKRFIITKLENKVVGTLMGILDLHGFLYIADVLVDPDVRRQKISTSMFFKIIKDWGIPNGVKTIWLQVESENKEAIDLYKKLGLVKAYSYYYLEKSMKHK
ncbi:MAG: GNAT family N-acetyltransferase, partial [Candidatus Hodarchaeota archaeon]